MGSDMYLNPPEPAPLWEQVKHLQEENSRLRTDLVRTVEDLEKATQDIEKLKILLAEKTIGSL